jgi:hypothetical protein
MKKHMDIAEEDIFNINGTVRRKNEYSKYGLYRTTCVPHDCSAGGTS